MRKILNKILLSSTLNQYYTVLCANLLNLGYGIIIGWASPYLPLLQSENTPISNIGILSKDQTTWLSSILCIGNLVGTVVCGIVVDRYGRKFAIYLISVPMILSWLMMIFANEVYLLYIARAVGGFVGGGTYLVIPIYVTEISNTKIRGTLGAMVQISCNLGIVVGFICGAFLDYYVFMYIALLFPILFIIGFSFIPETPGYLMFQNKPEEAEKSLRFFNNCRNVEAGKESIEFQRALERLKMSAEKQKTENFELSRVDFCSSAAKRAISIATVVMLCTQMCGVFYLINYSSMIFSEAGSTLDPNISSIIVSILLFIGSYLSIFFVDRSGRRILMTSSSFLTGFCLMIMGIYMYLKFIGYDVSNYSWISIISLSGAVFNSSWGIITLPYMIVAEILPLRTRGVIKMISRTILAIIAFLLLKYHYTMTEFVGFYGCMWLFAGCCFFETIFIAIIMPETSGKSNEEIIEILGKSAHNFSK